MSEANPNIGLILIDDSFIDRTIVSKNLELFYPEVSATFFDSATDAFDSIKSGLVLPDMDHCAVLLDIHMPEMNGFKFIDALNQLPKDLTKHYSIFMLSSSIDAGDMSRVEDRPLIKKFVSKPLNQEMLKNIFQWTKEIYLSDNAH